MPWWVRRTAEGLWLAGSFAAVRLPDMAGETVTAGLILRIAFVAAVVVAIYRARTRDWARRSPSR
jgi:hypothetical protein